MNFLPGWDSAEATASIAHYLHITAIIVLGLLFASEGLALIYDFRKEGLVETASRAAETARQQEAAAAGQRRRDETEALQKRLADADARLAEAQRAAAAAEKKASDIQQQAAPRHLTSKQRAVIARAIMPFARTPIKIVTSMGDNEAMGLAVEFLTLFREAGWEASGVDQAVYAGGDTAGIQLTLNPEDAAKNALPPGAEPLMRVLIAEGLAGGGYMNPEIPAGHIEMRIGPKPLK